MSAEVEIRIVDRRTFDFSGASEVLTPAERGRAARYHFEEDRDRFMAGRISLRRILAEHAHVAALDVAIEEGENRKPAVSLPAGAAPVYFNVSHSGDYIVIAISRAAEVGVDIEEMRPDCPVDDLARRYYCTREYAWLRTLAGEDRIEAFYRLWTVKEAVLKCAGLGLSVPTQMVEVHLGEGAPSVTCRDKNQKALEQLQVTELHPVPGYAGAVASAAYTDIRVVPQIA